VSDRRAPAASHEAASARARVIEAGARAKFGQIATARLLVGLATLACALWALQPASPRGTGWLALVGVLTFLVLVRVHDRVERLARHEAAVAAWHDARVARIARTWSALPAPWQPTLDPHHPFAHDLDLFGRGSVFELLGPVGTSAGARTLSSWLLEPASAATIGARHDAVRELAARGEFREQFAAHAALVEQGGAFDMARFLEWAESDAWLHARRWLLWLSRALALATPALLAAQGAGLVGGSWWLATLTLGLVATWVVRHPLDHAIGLATGWEPAIRSWVDLLTLVESTSFEAAHLRASQAALGAGHARASRQVARYQRVVAFAEVRHTALLHFPLHALTLWDFHVWSALERWQQRSGRHVRDWLRALGDIEALVALATHAADHPDWQPAVVIEGAERFDAHALGHPLLAPATCVRNDVIVGPPGRVLCVTGSNMSGKSTLLRAIGVNAVLAQAGATVCAASLRMPPVQVQTSLRIVDSLTEGVSYFMAALEQLKRVVEAADAAGRDGRPRRGQLVLYLLDEILQGTNSLEREEAVRIVLRHLLATPAIGAITTHDLALTRTPELADHGDHVHFRETLDEQEGVLRMTFDYRLHPGVATSRNALALMRLVGLADTTRDRTSR
jgi:hypothetical protein